MTVPTPKLLAEHDGVRLVIVPHSHSSCGDIINDPQAEQLIQDVEAEPQTQHPDDRGLFADSFALGNRELAEILIRRMAAGFKFRSLFRIRELSKLSTTTLNKRISGLRCRGCSKSSFAIFVRVRRPAGS